MRLRYIYTSVCVMLMSILCAQAQTVKSVTLQEAGTLSNFISTSERETLTELTVSGPMNGDDIAVIRESSPTLAKLDIKDATIVEGGNPYFVYNGKSYTTRNNTIGNYMFFAMASLKTLILPTTVEQIGEFKQVDGSYTNWRTGSLEECHSMESCSSLESITLPTSLHSIGGYAFKACARLTTITIPEGVEIIGKYAFQDCRMLESVKFPSTFGTRKNTFTGNYNPDENFSSAMSRYCGYMFDGCAALTSVTLPEGVTTLPSYMFNGCEKLTTVALPSTVTTLYSTFSSATGLQTLTLPEGMTYTGSFSGCTKLTSLTLPNGVTECPSFSGCISLASVNLSSGITTIADRAFQNCTALTEIVLPTGVTGINDYAFEGCNALSKITFSEALTSIGRYAFHNCKCLTSVTLPGKVITLGYWAFSDCDALETVVLPSTLTSMDGYCFQNCTKLKSINLPNNLFEIKEHAFENCSSLESIQLPRNLSVISNNLFNNCSALKTIDLPGVLIEIGYSAFENCTLLETISIPGSVQEIGSSAFANTSLTEVVLKDGLQSLGQGAFSGCDKLTTVTFPATINEINGFDNTGVSIVKFAEGAKPSKIGGRAFQYCSNLKGFTIPESVTSIGEEAFSNSGLESIIIPEAVISIGKSAFSDSKLQGITLPETVTEYGTYIFSGCRDLTKAELPQNMTVIPGGMFQYCSKLTGITLPAGTIKISNYAFQNCYALQNITLPENVTEVGSHAFYYCKLQNIDLPTGITTIGDAAFYTDNNLNSIVWNNATISFPADRFSHTKYLFLPEGGSTSNKERADYIFYGGVTEALHIEDPYGENASFSLPRELKAQQVDYKRNFSNQSGYGEAAGWQTIVLPFDVTEYSYVSGYGQDAVTVSLAPFGSKALETAGTLPFWLYELGTDGNYKAATELKANQAYLICMPNNDKYPSSSNISGEVTFAASSETGVTLAATAGALKPSNGTKFNLIPTYDGVKKSETVYALNENNYYYADDKTYPVGSVFIKNYNEHYENYPAVYPFHAYLTSNEGLSSASGTPKFYSIGGGNGNITGIPGLPVTPDKATKAYSRDGVLYIDTDADRTIRIYDVTGRTVRIIEAREGVNEVHGLESGIYLLEGQKVAVGR